MWYNTIGGKIIMEEWKDIKGFEGKYQVNTIGEVRSLPRNGTINKIKILTPQYSKDGYIRYGLFDGKKKKFFFAHRLVAQAFMPNNNSNLQINHIDGNKKNNSIKNLEWVTSKRNIMHAYEIGLKTPDKSVKNLKKYSMVGKENPKSKFVIQYDLKGNFIKQWGSINQIQKELGFASQNICCCCQGKYKQAFNYIWKYLEGGNK